MVYPICDGSWGDASKLKEILGLYNIAFGMKNNMHKYSIYFNGVEEDLARDLIQIYAFHHIDFQVGFKYLGFSLKPNYCGKND
jgi:hypothetical protein